MTGACGRRIARRRPVAEAPADATIISAMFNSGFTWRVEVQHNASFDLDLLRGCVAPFTRLGACMPPG
jgi:hypothetical protein